MKTISNWDALREYGIDALTGEACSLMYRILCDLTQNGKRIPDLAGYEKSVTHGIPITLHAPASIEAGIARRFFAEVQRRIHRSRRGGPSGGRQHVRREAVVAAS
jgi:hypothetical protein